MALMSPIHIIAIGIALIGVHLIATAVIALIAPALDVFAPLAVGSVLFAFALYVLGTRQKRD
jgi:hypothetical protein